MNESCRKIINGILFRNCIFLLNVGIWPNSALFLNNRVFPRIMDNEGVTTRSGKRHFWTDLVDWERQRLVLGGAGGPRITGNITLLFSTGKVRIGSVIENLDDVLDFLSIQLGDSVRPG